MIFIGHVKTVTCGKSSPEGFYYDSYDYDAFRRLLLEALLCGRPYCRAMHNVRTDEFIEMEFEQAKPDTVLVVDGIFLHRDELYRHWSFSVFLEADFSTTYERMATRDGCPPNPNDEANRRYRDGQLIYLRTCQPQARASLVIENNDPQRPKNHYWFAATSIFKSRIYWFLAVVMPDCNSILT